MPLDVATGYKPRWFQSEIHRRLKRFSVLVMHRRAGKCLDVATPIPTPAGFVMMGDLKAGDTVFAVDGTTTRVVAAHDVKVGLPCYRVTFSDGVSVVCDSEHLWFTQTKLDRTHHVGVRRGPRGAARYVERRHEPRPGSVKTTKEIARSLVYAGEFNHQVPLAQPVEYPEQCLPIDPYCLGAWLGDGHSYHAKITSMDEEVIAPFAVLWTVVPCAQQAGGLATTYAVNGGLRVLLRIAGLLRNKHIPEAYLRASIEQRKALLAGLMDTDGTISRKSNSCEIVQTKPAMVEDIKALLLSLGITYSTRLHYTGRATRIIFVAPFNPFRLKRKAEIWEPSRYWSSRARAIVSVEPVESRPVRCIEVDHPSRLFLCSEHYVPTHNTTLAINALINAALSTKKPEARFCYIAPYRVQVKAIAWDYFRAFTRSVPGIEYNESELSLQFPNGARIRLFGADNPDTLRGIYIDGAVLDEVADMRPEVWGEVIRPALADRRGWALFIGTPRGQNMFSELFHHAIGGTDPDWYGARYTVDDTGVIPEDELRAARSVMSDAQWRQEMLTDFSASADNVLITIDLASRAAKRVRTPADILDMPVILGVDIARYGSDRSCIIRRQGLQAFTPLVFAGLDNMQVAGHVLAQIQEHKPDAVFVDAGRGEGVIDRLRMLGQQVVEVHFGGKASSNAYANKRSEMWDLMRKWLEDGGAIPNEPDLKTDLCGPTYDLRSGQFMLERKEDMAKRGLRSPDQADSLALTFAFPVMPARLKRQAPAAGRQSWDYDPHAAA